MHLKHDHKMTVAVLALSGLLQLPSCKNYPKPLPQVPTAPNMTVNSAAVPPRFAATVTASVTKPRRCPKELARKTRQLMGQKLYPAAITHAQQLIHVPAGAFMGHFLLGRIASQRRHWLTAKQHYERSLQYAPNNLWANNNLGYVALELGHFPIAAQTLERATLHPKARGFMFNSLGIAYLGLGNKEKALDAFTQALQRDPANTVAQKQRSKLEAEFLAVANKKHPQPTPSEGVDTSTAFPIHLADSKIRENKSAGHHAATP